MTRCPCHRSPGSPGRCWGCSCWPASQAPYPPPNPRPIEVRQPDNTRIKLFFRGSPFYSWYEDTGGYTVVRDGKTYVYARRDSRGDLEPIKDLVVGKANPSQAGLARGIRPSPEAIERAREALMKKRRERSDPGQVGRPAGPGAYVYAVRDPSGEPVASDLVVRKSDPEAEGIEPGVRPRSEVIAEARAQERPGTGSIASRTDPPTPDASPVEVRKPDGTTVKLLDRGGWFEDPERYAVVRDGDRYVYAVRNSRGRLTPVAGLIVGRVDPAKAGLLKGLRPSAEAPVRD